jgi:hypothetical protein
LRRSNFKNKVLKGDDLVDLSYLPDSETNPDPLSVEPNSQIKMIGKSVKFADFEDQHDQQTQLENERKLLKGKS